MKKTLLLPLLLLAAATAAFSQKQWTAQKANRWYASQPWLVGANYIPANAINQLEMFQAETFDLAIMERELAMAESLGMNTMRIFLHDLLWKQDKTAFKRRIDQVLALCAKHRIRPMLVLFDSVWDPNPKLGKQHDPVPGVHNSGWVQSPGGAVLQDSAQWPELRAYVMDIVGHFRKDKRVLAWDIVNEPDNVSEQYPPVPNKSELGFRLVREAFGWAREAKPKQPITSAPWWGDWSAEKIVPFNRWLLENSDIITFHCYCDGKDFEQHIVWLQRFDRPMLCTEYLARGFNSLFETTLPVAKKYKVGAINWGFVEGKTNTIYPWSSWEKPFKQEPENWHHDIFRTNGTPYRQAEVDFIRKMTKR